ncbi:MAG: prepilin peptidase [Gemmatimonadota bacterium]
MIGPVADPVLAGILGLMLGSFLNVCAYRWPQDESVVRPRSRCGACGMQIAWYDNIPVVSWVILRGRCRRCGSRVSVQYPLVELATGLIWAGSFYALGTQAEAARGAVLMTLLLGIALTDARFYIIPDEFSVGGTVLGLALSFLPAGIEPLRALIGAAVGFGLLWLVALLGKAAFKKDAMGGGDIKMMAMIGAFLGTSGVLLTLFLGSLLGSLIFGPIAIKTEKLVPFGIFLSLGAAVTYVWGEPLLQWYTVSILGMG